MKYKFPILTLCLFSVFFLLVSPLKIHAQSEEAQTEETASEESSQSGEMLYTGYAVNPSKVVTVASDQVIDKDFYVAAADVVEIYGTVNGDVYAIAGQIIVGGTINGDLLAVAGTAILSGEGTEDARIIAGQITIDGKVGKNLTAAGGNIEITNGSVLSKGVLLAGGNISLMAPAAGDVSIAAGNAIVSSQVGGDLVTYTGSLRVSPDSTVAGNLVYNKDADVSIDNKAVISGTIIKREPLEKLKDVKAVSMQEISKSLAKAKRDMMLIGFLPILIVGLIIIKLFPKYVGDVNNQIQKGLLSSVLTGFAGLILTPIAALILFMTLVGIPIAGILLFAYVLLLYLARVYVAYWAGGFISKTFKRNFGNATRFVLGLVLLYVIYMIPILGSLVIFAVLIIGMGSAILVCFSYIKAGRARQE